jgi:hypothetical protein
MADPFSIGASSFAVVGAADVVLRASAECYRFFSSIKDAPDEVNQLCIAIKENKRLVQSLQKHLDELRDPASCISMPTQSSTSELYGFDSAFRALQREMIALEKLAKKHNGPNKTWGRVKWYLDERKIAKSREKLERAKSMLGLALSLLEGFVGTP